jgi:hypothetical protein
LRNRGGRRAAGTARATATGSGGVPGTGADDSAAVVTWPSRDIEGVAASQAHGLRPLAVIAIRPGASRPGPAVTGARHRDRARRAAGRGRAREITDRDLRIRQAGPADADAVARFGAEAARFDAQFSGTPARAGTATAMRREAERLTAASAGGQAGGHAGGSAAASAGEPAIEEAAGAGAASVREAVPVPAAMDDLGGPPSPHPALCQRCCRPSRVQPGNRTKKTFRLFIFPEMITISMH